MTPNIDIIRDFSKLQSDVASLSKANVELAQENSRLRAWIEALDSLAYNNLNVRAWRGDIGYLVPGAVAYYSSTSREQILPRPIQAPFCPKEPPSPSVSMVDAAADGERPEDGVDYDP